MTDLWAGGALTAVLCNPAFWMSMLATAAIMVILLFRD